MLMVDSEFRTVIRGYSVELVLEAEADAVGGGGYVSSCYVTRGEFGSSLGVLQDFGTIENDRGDTLSVPGAVIAAIETWASDRGY